MKYEDIVKRWQAYDIRSQGQLDKHLHNFRILFAYNSGKIENASIDYYDIREVFENGRLNAYTGDTRTVFELQNQRDCYEILKPKIITKEKISLQLIKQVHFELTKGTYDERRYLENQERPGEFKKHDYIVGQTEVGSDATDVETDLLDLLDDLNKTEIDNFLKAGAYLHANFENIHPFADGNGRVGRTLLNYYLMINNHPPIIIYEEDKKDYYQALEAFDNDLHIDNLYNFLIMQCQKTWKS